MSTLEWVLLIGAGLAIAYLLVTLRRARQEILRGRNETTLASGRLQAQERKRVAAEERERIFHDLHDDLGAKLLDLVLTAPDPTQADAARALLQDLRDVVSRSRGEPGSLQAVLAEIHRESESRLGALDVELVWEVDAAVPDPELDHGDALHLFRIVREALSNALKHARPCRIRVRAGALGDELLLDVTDEGGTAAPAGSTTGRGTDGMRSRADALHGTIAWDPGTQGGTKVILRMPLRP